MSENSSGGWIMLNRRPARGIEKCECPSKYKSSSCQNPGTGFFRWYKVFFETISLNYLRKNFKMEFNTKSKCL